MREAALTKLLLSLFTADEFRMHLALHRASEDIQASLPEKGVPNANLSFAARRARAVDRPPCRARPCASPGTGPLATASLGTTKEAFVRTDELGLKPFGASVTYAQNGDFAANSGFVALGPAVSFEGSAPYTSLGPLRREIDVTLPVNPAAMPRLARLRHVEVLYSGPRAKKPRVVPVASPRIVPDGQGGYLLAFSTPWLGSYQAGVRKGAGEGVRRRKLTHRAVLGFSKHQVFK